VVAALIANGGIAIAKFVGYAFTGAASMLAEAVHSVADTGNQALLLMGSSSAQREATDEHPFGYGRERYFWAFVVALVLFSLGGVYALYEGVHKFMHPQMPTSVGWAYGILSVGIVLEGISFRTAIQAASKVKGDQSWARFVTRTKEPELSVVLLEDLGALLGLVIALVGVALAQLTGDGRWDAMGSMAIGLLLGAIAVVLAIEMKSLLIGEAADKGDRRSITDAIEGAPQVSRLITMRTQHLSPDEILLGCKVEFDPGLDGVALTHAIDEAEARVRAAVPEVKLIYMEPDQHEQRPAP
jgi:cation diffusion facilitator family transporter